MPLAPAPTEMLKVSTSPLQTRSSKVEELRPSSHLSICRAEMTGTPRAWAENTMASESDSSPLSLWMFAVMAP